MSSNTENKGHWKVDWGRQGRVIIAYIIIFFGYYGIVANFLMFDEGNEWFTFINISESVKTMLFWTYEFYLMIFFLPCLLLFIICFWLTYKEDISHYGIRASLWLAPFIIFEGFIFYFIMFGFSLEPFILQFAYFKGYLNISIIIAINLFGSLSGMLLRRHINSRHEIKLENNRGD
ncbi:MAG: hypothetical protein ACTSV5_11955 [Promethearchaeota archaeon]